MTGVLHATLEQVLKGTQGDDGMLTQPRLESAGVASVEINRMVPIEARLA